VERTITEAGYPEMDITYIQKELQFSSLLFQSYEALTLISKLISHQVWVNGREEAEVASVTLNKRPSCHWVTSSNLQF
jgi:hypothetical protein